MEILEIKLDFFGKLTIAYTALRVHHIVLNEHKIDKEVFSSMKREQGLGLFGIFLLIIGFALKLYIYYV